MESASVDANRVAMSAFSSKNDEEMVRPSPDPTQSGEGNHAPNPSISEAQDPLKELLVANVDEVRDYGCKYCEKRFSNKQALGGHQNAHKTVRAMEKQARELQQNQFAYLGGPSSYPLMASTPTFPGSFNVRSHEYLSRAMINRPFHSQVPVHQGMHIGYYPLPMSGTPYALHPLYPGWHIQMPRVSQYMVPDLHMPYNTLNLGFPPTGMGSSSAWPVSEAHPDFVGSQLIPGGQNNSQSNNPEDQDVEEPELDLLLRL